MSLSTQQPPMLKELLTGLHLTTITDTSVVKGDDGLPLIWEGQNCIRIRFTWEQEQVQKHFDHKFWIKGESQPFFLKMCAAFNIDPTNPKFRAEALGKRGWLAIKEVHGIYGEVELEAVNYLIFDFKKWNESLKKPKMVGDPELGPVGGAFLDYMQIETEIPKKVNVVAANPFLMGPVIDIIQETVETLELNADKKERLNFGDQDKTSLHELDHPVAKALVAGADIDDSGRIKAKEEIIAEQKAMIAKVENKQFPLTEKEMIAPEKTEDTFVSLSQRHKKEEPKTGIINWEIF